MIIQISKKRIVQVALAIILTLSLWITIGFWVSHRVHDSPEGRVVVTFNFLAPMKPSATEDLIITEADNGRKVPFTHQWLTASKLQVTISETRYPLGRKYFYHFKLSPAMIWPFYVWAAGEFQGKVKLRFVGIDSKGTVPSRGPITLQFNTNVQPQKISNFVFGPVPGKIIPSKTNLTEKKQILDYSRWEYWPNKKLNNLCRYSMDIKAGLPSQTGGKLTHSIKAEFVTTPEFLIEKALPQPGSDSVWLTREILLQTNQQLKSGHVYIKDLSGQCQIKGNTIRFITDRVMMPGKKYTVKANLTSTSNESLDFTYSFSTTNLGHNRWLELKLDQTPVLWLMEGNRTLHKMNVRVKPDRTIPRGTLYELRRHSESPWMHLNADILLHPLSENVADNHDQLNLPKSYSCIYLQEKDAKKLFHALPPGFMLICH
ncbi:hypothetical protein Dred_1964 [Desulforamulus reducens MI-1]|uniref:Uncharacterized protein n=1 Tax=Desulforamulus reducens (strain ATCC BAA-1160 / DSM 100696 / MI-1) TaxID=349161 RepID=A4J5X9_DESRM|nr:L,D-transpeptidase [Desulforamulus reducens]ABO50482.1 hypothetical protein Dred_1964 [Desulforamulus reducens MI-1]